MVGNRCASIVLAVPGLLMNRMWATPVAARNRRIVISEL